MAFNSCAGCGIAFEPRPQTPKQAYCSLTDCQRLRRQRWQRNKLQNDPDYQDNQSRSQRAWMDRNPDYWRQYRQKNPAYAERNRNRNRLRSKSLQPGSIEIAKMDASMEPLALHQGIYRITPVQLPRNQNTDSWVFEIVPIDLENSCKSDACKDRT